MSECRHRWMTDKIWDWTYNDDEQPSVEVRYTFACANCNAVGKMEVHEPIVVVENQHFCDGELCAGCGECGVTE